MSGTRGGWVAVGDGACVYLNQHSFLQCFDLESGDERWSRELAGGYGAIFGHVTILGGRVLVGGWRGVTDVIAYDVFTGELAWSRPSRELELGAPVSVDHARALLPYPHEGFAAVVDVTDGRLEDTVSCPTPGAPFDAMPFVVRQNDDLYCVDDAARVWHRDSDLDREWSILIHHKRPLISSAPAPTGSFLVLVDQGGSLAVHDRRSGSRLWAADVQHRRCDRSPAAALPGERLAFGSSAGHLFVFDRDGSVIARRHFGKPFEDLVATADGSLIATTGGRVISVAVDG